MTSHEKGSGPLERNTDLPTPEQRDEILEAVANLARNWAATASAPDLDTLTALNRCGRELMDLLKPGSAPDPAPQYFVKDDRGFARQVGTWADGDWYPADLAEARRQCRLLREEGEHKAAVVAFVPERLPIAGAVAQALDVRTWNEINLTSKPQFHVKDFEHCCYEVGRWAGGDWYPGDLDAARRECRLLREQGEFSAIVVVLVPDTLTEVGASRD